MELDKDLHKDAGYNSQDQVPGTTTIPVIHEEVSIGTRFVETGRIKVTKNVNEEEQLLDIPLTHDEIDVQTIPVNQYVDVIPEPVRYEGDTMIIPVLKEVHVVRIMVEKEIHITKKKVQTVDHQTISLRKEEITIENIHPAESQDASKQNL